MTSPPLEGFHLTAAGTPVRALVREIWRARRLATILARKDFYVRYRRASLGMFWAVALPLIQAAIIAVVFQRVVGNRITTDGPFVAFLMSGMVAWSFISAVVGGSATSIVDNSSLSSRIYFPRAILPLSGVLSNVYGFGISIVVTLAVELAIGVSFGPELVLLVPGAVLAILLVSAFALLLASLHVYFRDVRYIVSAALTAWFYITPVLYPIDFAPESVHPVIKANPATGVIELFRAATVGADPGWGVTVVVTCAWILVVGVAAMLISARFDRVFSDRL